QQFIYVMIARRNKMNQNLPPKRPILNINTIPQDTYRPLIVYLKHSIFHQVQESLHEDKIDWNLFFQTVCLEYLVKKQKKKDDDARYIAFSEMQLFEKKDLIIDQIELSESDDGNDKGLFSIENDSHGQ
ncbi:hypothetical protein UFOVP97_1, partial [uncultured Caudovirales phage]